MLNKNKKMALALGAAFALSGIFAHTADAASLSEAEKVKFEEAYLNNSVSNQASRMLLKNTPKTVAGIKDKLNAQIKDSDALLAESKPVVDTLRPERANESKEIKDLDNARFNNLVNQEAIYLLFDLAPNQVEAIKGQLVDNLNKAVEATSESDQLLASLRDQKLITIVHYNDIHGRVEENEKDGEIGMAKIKTFYDYKNVANNAILLDAGDTFHGTTFANITNGQAVLDAMNKMGITAMTAGNHDFNYGYQRLIELNKAANFDVMGSNVLDENGNPILNTGKIVEIDGIKFGIFGLSTPETKTKSSPLNTQGLTFADTVETAKNEIANLKANGAQIIVALTHLGDNEATVESSTRLVNSVEGIDIVIDGHSHTQLDNGHMIKNTLVAQTGSHGYNLGEVSVLVDKDGKVVNKVSKLHPYSEVKYLHANDAVSNVVAEYANKNKEVLEVKVGKTSVDLDGVRENVRTRETNLGSFIADAMKDAIGVDVTITNGGGIRDSIKAGDITKGDVLRVFPFTNFLVKIEVTGADLKAALEHGLTDAPKDAGKFPQIAGMTVKYDSSKPAGSRVIEVLVNGEALDLNKTYSLATNDFMAIGGDGYTMFEGKTRTEERGLISDIFEEAIKKSDTISPGTYNRLEDVSEAVRVNRAG